MRAAIALLVSFLLAFGFPLRVAASDPLLMEQGPPDELIAALPIGVNPIDAGITYEAAASDPLNGEINAASFEFSDDLGRSYIFHATFSPYRSFWIEATDSGTPNGAFLGAGTLSEDQAYILKKAAEERRRTDKGEERWLQPVWIIPAIGIVIGLGSLGLAIYYGSQQAGTDAQIGMLNDQISAMCLADRARDTVDAQESAALRCPPRAWTTPSGQICRSNPELRRGNATACEGDTYVSCGQVCI